MTTRSQVPLKAVLNTGLFNYEKAASSAGWIRELQGEHTPETEEYGIASFTYTTAHPFDAEKLWTFLHDPETWRGVLRSKGFFWVAADHRAAYEWAQAGGLSSVNVAGMWWAAIPRNQWHFPEGHKLISVLNGLNGLVTELSRSCSLDKTLMRARYGSDSMSACFALRSPMQTVPSGHNCPILFRYSIWLR